MKCSLGISNFHEEISSLSHSVVFLYFFAFIAEEGFLGGEVDKNLPAIAGDMGSVPELGRSYMLWSNLARAPQLLRSLCHNQRSHSSEKPMQHDREQPSLTRGERRVVWLQWAPGGIAAGAPGSPITCTSHT